MEKIGFYERLKDFRALQGNEESAEAEECVRSTVQALISQPTDAARPGMLLGKIQSGKTRAFLGIVALAFDVAVVLTKGTRTLAKQTVNRISREYSGFREAEQLAVYDIMTVPALTDWEIDDQKLVIVAKKESNNLRRLVTMFSETHPALSKKRVLIVDDEADFASIRFTKKTGSDEIEQGRIADQIDDLRRQLTNPAVLQVTATPYSLYLQPEEYELNSGFKFEPKRPSFTVLVPIHDGYVGGDHYFGQHDESEPEFYLWHKVLQTELDALKKEDRRRVRADQILNTEKIAALRHALITFVTAASIRRIQQQKEGETPKRYAMVVHVETSRKSHDWQHTVVGEVLDAMKDAAGKNDPIFIALINEALSDLAPSMEAENLSIPPEKEIVLAVRRAFQRGGVVTETVNSDKDVETLLDENAELRLRTPYNVFIGGQILDRGITVPNLIGFYYGRSPKRMQQDTVLQHARMYGNRPRKDLAVTRFYTSAHNYLALAAIHDFDAALRFAFETGAHDRGVAFVHRDTSKSIIPCAPSKILLSEIVSLRPGGAHVPFGFQTISKTKMEPILSKIDQLTSKASEGGPGPIRASSDLAVQIIELIEGTLQFETGYDFDWDACKAAIEYFSKIASPEAEQGNCWLLVRTGRTIKRIRKEGRYSDAPHTYQDRTAIKKIDGFLPVLALFRQEGRNEDDWKGTPFWWPVLFAPKNASPAVFAASISED